MTRVMSELIGAGYMRGKLDKCINDGWMTRDLTDPR